MREREGGGGERKRDAERGEEREGAIERERVCGGWREREGEREGGEEGERGKPGRARFRKFESW